MSVLQSPLTLALLLAVGVILAVLYTLMALIRPWYATVVALASLAFVPFWIGVAIGGYFVSAHLVLIVLACIAILVSEKPQFRINIVDLLMVGLLFLSLIALELGLTTATQPYTFLQAVVLYSFARLAVAAYGTRRVFTVLAVTFPFVALAMMFEFITGVNPWLTYLSMNNSLYQQWSGQQSRGGVLRAEGPFGHSIAAGCSLAVAAVLTLDAKLRPWLRLIAVVVMLGGILVTISRIGMITAALGLGLAVVFSRSTLTRRAKAAVLLALATGAAVFVLFVNDIFEAAGTEATDSAAYRLWILDLLPLLQPVGYASGFSRSTDGTGSFGGYRSIDNFILEYSLKNGWVPAAILLLLMLVAIVRLITRRGGLATAVVVAQLPALFSVALITTYGLVFWASVGLAVSEAVSDFGRRRSSTIDSKEAATESRPEPIEEGVPSC